MLKTFGEMEELSLNRRINLHFHTWQRVLEFTQAFYSLKDKEASQVRDHRGKRWNNQVLLTLEMK